MKRLGVVAAGLVVAAVVAFQAAAVAGDEAGPVLGPGEVTVELRIENSRFLPARIDVVDGTTVRFVVRNDDPIGHELIVGDEVVHRRHERGTEAAHAPVPGEVSVGPLATGETTYAFADGPGKVEFACHLPGHLAYGMRGEVVVHARAS